MRITEPATQQAKGNTWYVLGDSGTTYTVHYRRHARTHRKQYTCNCIHFFERCLPAGDICKHIEEVIIYRIRLRRADAGKASFHLTVKSVWSTLLDRKPRRAVHAH